MTFGGRFTTDPIMLKSIILLLPVIPTIALTSCFGGGLYHTKKDVLTSFRFEKFLPNTRKLVDGKGARNPSGKEIIAAWGEPDRRKAVERDIVWTYDSDLAYSGVVPMAGVAIPLVVPTGVNGTDFYFSGQSPIPYKAEKRYSTLSGSFVAPLDGPPPHGGYKKVPE